MWLIMGVQELVNPLYQILKHHALKRKWVPLVTNIPLHLKVKEILCHSSWKTTRYIHYLGKLQSIGRWIQRSYTKVFNLEKR
jgi:hypothetical protein